MGLKQDLVRVSFSNFIVLISSIVNGILLPSVLSMESFANLKTYTLYASFIGFMHLGFVDGINVKYGGHNPTTVRKKEFNGFHSFFIIFQFLIVSIVLLIGLLSQNTIIILLGMAILPINLQSFFLYYFQATGRFKEYSKATIIVPLINISITLLLFILEIKDFRLYILVNILSYFVSILFLEFKNKKEIQFNLTFKFENHPALKALFVSGFFIMTGNVLFTLFFDTGRWMAKFFSDTEGFAKYSLGLSLIGFILVFINAVNKTFYPYLSRNNSSEIISRYKNILYIIGSFSLGGYFLIKEIIIQVLPKYTDSLALTAILITSIPGMMIIKSIYVNQYKIYKKELKFLVATTAYLIFALILNSIIYFIYPTLQSLAIASVLSIYIWTVFPINFYKIKFKEVIHQISYLFLVLSTFSVIYNYQLSLFSSIIALTSLLILINFMFFKKTFMQLISNRKL